MNWKKIIIISFIIMISIGIYGCKSESEYQRLYEEAEAYASRGDYDSALNDYSILVEAYPDKAEAYLGRGNTYIKRIENHESLTLAIKDYKEALELEPDNVEIYVAMIDAYIRASAFDVAEELLMEAQQKFKDERIDEWLEDFIPQDETCLAIRDLDDNLRKVSRYDEYLNLEWYILCFYENRRSAEAVLYDANKTQKERVVCEYDEKGNQLTDYSYSWQGLYIVNRTYDESNREISSITSDMNGQIWYIKTYGYDGDFLKWEKYENYAENMLTYVSEYQYKYNGQGEQIQSICESCYYDEYGNLETRSVTEYDENSEKTKTTEYDASGEITYQEEF